MKQKINIAQANISNLTRLWKKVSTPFDGYFQSDQFQYCYLENSDWPNRLWFRNEITPDCIEKARQVPYLTSKKLVIPCWDTFENGSELLEAAGFQEKSVQIGMSLELHARADRPLRLQMKRVLNKAEAKVWAEVYPEAFGYQIGEAIPARLDEEVEFYLACFQSKAIGTAMIFKTDNITGIHGVGVHPEARRKGFAEEIMEFLLKRAVDSGVSYVTLQASPMGKPLYVKLGFKEDFIIKNYISNQ
jgi:ribosomal protein S18 acetylase RimI-like enzyme